MRCGRSRRADRSRRAGTAFYGARARGRDDLAHAACVWRGLNAGLSSGRVRCSSTHGTESRRKRSADAALHAPGFRRGRRRAGRSGRSRHEGAVPAGAPKYVRVRAAQAVRPAFRRPPTAPALPPPLPNTTPCCCRWIIFTDRFRRPARWLIYDRRRDYGYYYDGADAPGDARRRPRHDRRQARRPRWLGEDERQFQLLWKNYFRARWRFPSDQRASAAARMMPRRYWEASDRNAKRRCWRWKKSPQK